MHLEEQSIYFLSTMGRRIFFFFFMAKDIRLRGRGKHIVSFPSPTSISPREKTAGRRVTVKYAFTVVFIEASFATVLS